MDRRYTAGALIALGVFLVFAGPAVALVTLLASVSAEPDVAGASAISTMHAAGLLAGLLGGILLVAGLVWLLIASVRAKRRRQASSASGGSAPPPRADKAM